MQEPISRSTWAVSPSARVTDLQHVNSGGHRTVGDPQQKPGSIHCEKERKKERRKRWTHFSQMGASYPSLIASSRSGGCWKTKGKRSKRDQVNQETERAAETGRNGQSGTKSRRRKCRRRKTKKNFSLLLSTRLLLLLLLPPFSLPLFFQISNDFGRACFFAVILHDSLQF